MNIFLIILSISGLSLTAFGWWGTKTKEGQQKFDEMAGMIPYFSYYLGIAFLVISLGIFIYLKVKK